MSTKYVFNTTTNTEMHSIDSMKRAGTSVSMFYVLTDDSDGVCAILLLFSPISLEMQVREVVSIYLMRGVKE